MTVNNRILTTFIPGVHDGPAPAVSLVLGNRALQGLEADGTTIIPTVKLTARNGNPVQYQRHIWLCVPPFVLQPGVTAGTWDCVPAATIRGQNACDNGAGGGPASPVSMAVFTNAAPSGKGDPVSLVSTTPSTKKLACCMNAFNPVDPANPATQTNVSDLAKFDCIDNSKTKYKDF